MKTKDSVFRLLHEDQNSIVIEKLQAFDSQANEKTGKEALFEFVSRAIGQKLYPVHRLDRDVLGLIIFAKSKNSAEELSQQFRDRSVSKLYLARVLGEPKPSSKRLVHYLKKNPNKNFVTVFPRETPGAKKAALSYETIEQGEYSALLRIKLETGRPHQIRAQLAKHGVPILGDDRYGQKSLAKLSYNGPIMLVSAALEFQSAGKVQLSIEAELKDRLAEPKKIL